LQPVVFLHGGPGGGTSPSNRRFFDPEFYRIILFDQVCILIIDLRTSVLCLKILMISCCPLYLQRGAGKSTPHACLEENSTWDLISDIEKLREHLEVPEWQVMVFYLVIIDWFSLSKAMFNHACFYFP